ncbi:MAG: AhpC/TSA family protein [Bacteroidetes bacterium]|nr:MAG: AhpC/TSA family protein [Bacteroidota bacterium]TAG94304.1 MAG: AhpC/TSA family protein [Bacteroidota bacterium]
MNVENNSFKEELKNLENNFLKAVPINEFNTHEKELKESDIPKLALNIGDKMPDFILKNAVGNPINSEDLLDKKWLVLSFYRGQWCPFCQFELQNLQKNLSSIENCPARLVAISPQTPDNSLTTKQKNDLTFDVLSDEGSLVGKKFNIVYTVPNYLEAVFKKIGVDVQYMNGAGNMQLPIPATYVIDNQGIIRMRFLEVSFLKRLDPQELVEFMSKN